MQVHMPGLAPGEGLRGAPNAQQKFVLQVLASVLQQAC